ncbi:MAG: metalloregulator ArsR/SmtB family transcription factor [Acidobacteria bacterium]|nr:metalloregulator ArsR/SmtB family transcription factor [Acidobacteriota bacterium]
MQVIQSFKALADGTRLRLVNLSLHFELNVNEIVRIMEMGQSRISRHLKILSESGLLSYRRDGLRIFYSVARDGEGATFIKAMRHFIKTDGVFGRDLTHAEKVVAERTREASDLFEAVAEDWERLKREILDGIDLNRKILDTLPRVRTLVDLGCGTGELLPLLRKRAQTVIGVEKSARMLEEARKHYTPDKDGIEIRFGELEHLPLGDGEADAAVVNMVLHHLAEPRKAFAETQRVLRSKGTFVIVELLPHKDESMRLTYGDLWLGFSPDLLARWLHDCGFTTKREHRFDLNKGLQGFILKAEKQSSI